MMQQMNAAPKSQQPFGITPDQPSIESSPGPPRSPDFQGVLREIRRVLTVVEIARATGVKERQVHHWSSGAHQPKGASRDRLLLLYRLVVELEVAFDPERAKVWLFSQHPELGHRPIDLIVGPESDDLLRAARQAVINEKPSDLSLVRRARVGSTGAYDLLIRRYRGFVREKAHASQHQAVECDDLVQEGLLGLYKAIRDFDEEGEEKFRNFAEAQIVSQILTAAASVRTLPTISPGRSMVIQGQSERSQGDEREGHSRAAVDDLLAEVWEKLQPDEQRLLDLYLDGRPLKMIGELTDSSPEEIESWLKTLKRKIGSGLARDSTAQP
jgi:RNA polymerase sporulation-specific sigma factor